MTSFWTFEREEKMSGECARTLPNQPYLIFSLLEIFYNEKIIKIFYFILLHLSIHFEIFWNLVDHFSIFAKFNYSIYILQLKCVYLNYKIKDQLFGISVFCGKINSVILTTLFSYLQKWQKTVGAMKCSKSFPSFDFLSFFRTC